MSKKLHRCLSLVLVTMLLASISISGAFTASADTQTGDGLAAYAMTAYNEGWQYVWGGASYGYVDCSGLIYSYGVGGGRTDSQMLAASPESGYVADGVPDIPGIGLWQPGHVGVYVGNGMAVDARDEVSNVCYSSVDSKGWVMWFKVAGVTYDSSSVTNQTQSTDTSSDTDDTDTSLSDVILQKGDSGADVNALQERLKQLGYFEDDTTQYFGSYTESCLINFQTAAGLAATGIYDEATKNALMSDNAPSIVQDSESDSDSDTNTEPVDIATEEPNEDSDNNGVTDNEYTDNIIEADSDETEIIGIDSEFADNDISDTESTDSENIFADFGEYVTDENADNSSDISEYLYQTGDEGEGVLSVQQRLADLKYYYGEIDGVYNDETAYAVARYQFDADLDITGFIDSSTYDILFAENVDVMSDTASVEKTEEFYLKEGMTADVVTDMQDKLYELRYLTVDSSGVYDEATVNAVELFQEVNGYAATNYITEEQFNLLISGYAQKSPRYNILTLGYEGEDVVKLQNVLSSMGYLDYSILTQLGLYDEATKSAVIKAQTDLNVEADGTASEEFVTMLKKQSQNVQEQSTSSAAVSASDTSSAAITQTSTAVDVPKTGVEDYINKTFTLVVIGITMLIILFAVTVHYWNVSMEKRRKRARKNSTVSGYRRRYM